jgi:hypothetical protein
MKDYKTRPLSFSGLTRLLVSPQYFLNPGEKKSSGFGIGNAVDIFTTEGEDAFNKKVFLNTMQPITGQLLTLADEMYKEYCISDKVGDILDIITPEIVYTKMNELKLYSNVKDTDKRIAKFDTSEFWDYLSNLQKMEGKVILSEDDYYKSKEIINSFQNNEYTKEYFKKTTNEIVVLNQHEITWKYMGQEIISKLDKVIINHSDKTIQAIDIKTMAEPTKMFSKSYYKWKYYYQASLYLAAIYYEVINAKSLPEYTILPFKFVVETTGNTTGQPMVYVVADEDIAKAREGGDIYNRKVKGWHKLIEDKCWYDENGYDTDRDYIETNATQLLNIYD